MTDETQLRVGEVHPYFTAKARRVFELAEGDPDLSGPLAVWAQAARAEGDSRRRVLVAEDGVILAESRYMPGIPGASYVVSVTDERFRRAVNRVEDLARGEIAREYGRRVIVVTYSDVCTGPGTRASK